jgi:CPA2 family monovalent cation:H+ antiporter-2
LPLRDAFAVLFFVSVGMLFDPAIVWRQPLPLLATIAIIIFGKSIAAFVIVRLFGHPNSTALTVSASLAQIGEFSFILAGLGVSLSLLTPAARDLILAGAILSILLNPLCFAALDRWFSRVKQPTAEQPATRVETPAREPIPTTHLTDHVVLVGHGRVGSFISGVLKDRKVPFLVIENDRDTVKKLRAREVEAITASGTDTEALHAANLAQARCLLVAIPDAFEGGQVVEQAREINGSLPIVARAHSEAEIDHLKRHGANIVVMGEHEIAKAMLADIPSLPQ